MLVFCVYFVKQGRGENLIKKNSKLRRASSLIKAKEHGERKKISQPTKLNVKVNDNNAKASLRNTLKNKMTPSRKRIENNVLVLKTFN